MAKPTQRPTPKKEGFYEVMPNAYMDRRALFAPQEQAQDQEPVEMTSEQSIRQHMVRQLLVLVGLLIVQFVLFAILIQSTINLT